MRIVLVRPRDPNNIGAAARAMANFGLSDLVVVAPWAPVWREARSAVGAGQVLAEAREVDSLAEALADCALAGATTAGTRRRLARVVGPEPFAEEAHGLGAGELACLVFGDEKRGLTSDEIARCQVAVRIATGESQPSMNLGQAVAVCCYAASCARSVAARPAPARGERRATLGEIEAALEAAYPTAADPRVEARHRGARDRLRALLLRARASASDVSLVRGLAGRGDRSPSPAGAS